jgi:hypothetical protein
MTSIEFLREKLHNDYGLAFSDSIIVQALEIHKAEILSAFTEGANDGYDGCYDSNKEKYYQETFVNKGHPSVISENGNELLFDKEGNLIKELPKQETLYTEEQMIGFSE